MDGPGRYSFAVTPNDGTDLAHITRMLYVGGAGNISLQLEKDTANTTLNSVPAGTMLYLRVRKINATGTTANSIVGIY